jgi:hypothetical protein
MAEHSLALIGYENNNSRINMLENEISPSQLLLEPSPPPQRPPPPRICYCITINKTLLFIIGMLLITSIVFFIFIIVEPKTNPINTLPT